MTEAVKAIAKALRAQDRDRYVSVLYAPAEKRHALFALYAFNAEIASIRDRIHEPLPGEIRLQWWRDVIESGTVEAAAGHPLASALVDTIRVHQLPTKPFLDMLDARIFDLYDDPMPTRTDLEGYCGETASAMIQLACVILDRSAAEAVADAAGHAGCAQAISGLLRSLPITRARGQSYLPADLLAAAGTTPAAFIQADDEAAGVRAMEAMIALGREHWSAFQRRAADIPAVLRPAFLPAALTPSYLLAVERIAAKALRQSADTAGWRKQWLMFRTASKGL